MSGPVTKPSDLQSPVPAVGAYEEALKDMGLYVEPGKPLTPNPSDSQSVPESENAAPASKSAYEEALADMGMTPEQAAPPVQAAPTGLGESLLEAGKQVVKHAGLFPAVVAMKSLYDSYQAGSVGEAPLSARMLAKTASQPLRQAEILQKQMGPEFQVAVDGDEVVWRPVGSSEWKPLDRKDTGTLREFVADVADWAPEFGEGAVQSGIMAAGASLAPATAGTSLLAAGAVSGLSSGVASVIREGVSRLSGASENPDWRRDVGIATGAGFAGGVLGQFLVRKAADKAKDAIVKGVEESSGMGKAAKVSELQNELDTLHRSITGSSHPAIAGAKTAGEAGVAGEAALEGIKTELGQAIETAFDAAEVTLKGQRLKPQDMPELMKVLNDDLGRYYSAVSIAPTKPGGKVIQDLKPFREVPERLKDYYLDMRNLYKQIVNNDGMTLKEYKGALGDIKRWANWDNKLMPSEAESAWRNYIPTIAKERDALLTKLSGNSEQGNFVVSAFEKYRNNIESLRDLVKISEKSPEKFANALFKDMKTAQIAKDTFNLSQEGRDAWNGIKAAWLQSHIDEVKDLKTGIVDLKKLSERLGKNTDLADEVFGYGTVREFERLGTAMDKITWKDLLKNPDTIQNTGMIRAFAKMVISKFNPAYAANALGALVSYDPEVLSLIQQKGILSFAKEANTMATKNHWLQAASAIDRLQKVLISRGPKGQWEIPLDRALIGSALNAGYRSFGQTDSDMAEKRQAAQSRAEAFIYRNQRVSPGKQ